MKVLHVINSLEVGGAERLIIDSLSLYKERKVDVDLLLLKDGVASYDAKLGKGVNIIRLSTSNLYSPFIVFKLFKYLKKYDIVHAHLFPTIYWVTLAKVLSTAKTLLVYTEHNTHNRRRDIYFFKVFDRFIYSHFSFIGCISTATRENLLLHLRLPKDTGRVETVLNGIDLKRFKLSNFQNMSDFGFFKNDSFVLLQVSSFSKQKDQLTLINSMNYLPPNVVLLLVGDGGQKAECAKRVEELGLEGRVKFLGIRFDVPKLIQYCDVSILSSHYEGFGLAVLEGMASKKAVISSNIPGVEEIVKEAGLLFEKGDEQDLARKILMLYNDPVLKELTAERCYQRALKYDINTMVDKYSEIYVNLLKAQKN